MLNNLVEVRKKYEQFIVKMEVEGEFNTLVLQLEILDLKLSIEELEKEVEEKKQEVEEVKG